MRAPAVNHRAAPSSPMRSCSLEKRGWLPPYQPRPSDLSFSSATRWSLQEFRNKPGFPPISPSSLRGFVETPQPQSIPASPDSPEPFPNTPGTGRNFNSFPGSASADQNFILTPSSVHPGFISFPGSAWKRTARKVPASPGLIPAEERVG